MRLIFLGGVFTPHLREQVFIDSIGNIQNAADVFQRNLLLGFSHDERLHEKILINFPFIGSYPRYYRKVNFNPKEHREDLYGFSVRSKAFFNLFGLKNFSRAFSAFKELFSILRSDSKNENDNVVGRYKDQVVVCYSMHLPFLLACFFVRFFVPKFKFIVVVPDLPEFMANRSGISKLLSNFFSKFTYITTNKAQVLVLLTEQMASRFSDHSVKIIVEGMVDQSLSSKPVYHGASDYILYSGTLDFRYGIKELLDSFVKANIENLNLVICGHGEASNYVRELSEKHHNIIFKGLVRREDVIELQFKAKFLINPRRNDSDFTKYSFPSKIMEYLVTGVPVVMFKLDGIPEEYNEFFFRIPDEAIDFSDFLISLNSLDLNYLKDFGLKARNYVKQHKDPFSQAKLIIDSF